MNKEKILEKARKLKALSCSSNEHEAQLALQRMQFILAKHGLEERDLEKDEFGRLRFEYNGQPWARNIVASIAELYFCKVMYVPMKGGKTMFTIIGSDINAATVKDFAIHIMDAVHYNARQVGQSSSEITSFRFGASMSISRRCSELIKIAGERGIEDEGDDNSVGSALVIGDFYKTNGDKIEQWMMENIPGLKKGVVRKVNIDPVGYAKGVRYGETVELRRKIA